MYTLPTIHTPRRAAGRTALLRVCARPLIRTTGLKARIWPTARRRVRRGLVAAAAAAAALDGRASRLHALAGSVEGNVIGVCDRGAPRRYATILPWHATAADVSHRSFGDFFFFPSLLTPSELCVPPELRVSSRRPTNRGPVHTAYGDGTASRCQPGLSKDPLLPPDKRASAERPTAMIGRPNDLPGGGCDPA
jgi:hypothetical protein